MSQAADFIKKTTFRYENPALLV